MNTKKISTEIDLGSIIRLILKNKLKLFLIVIIGITLSLINEKLKKPLEPNYEISTIVENITLFNEQKYSSLNNFIEFDENIDLFNSYSLDKNLIRLDKDLVSNRYDGRQNLEITQISSKYLLDLFNRIFNEKISSFQNLNIKDIKTKIISEDDLNNQGFENFKIQILIVSNNGDLEAWKKYLQNQIIKTNEDVRNFLANLFQNEILNMKQNHEFILNNISLIDESDPKLEILSSNLINRLTNAFNSSPIYDPETFFAVKIPKNENNVKIIDTSPKKMDIKMLILISIITSFIIGIIYILVEESLIKTKSKQ